MPKIPTIIADPTLRGAPQQEAGTGAFSETRGLGEVSRGLLDVSVTLPAVARLDRVRESQRDAQYVGDSLFQELSHLDEWQAKNVQSETYYQDFRKYAESRISQYEEAAPSRAAAVEVRQKLQHAILSRGREALATTERNRLENARESVVSQTSFAIGSVRAMRGLPHGDPVQSADQSREEIRQNVDRMFSTVDPAVARKLRGYVDGEFALAVAEVDQGRARSIIRESQDLSEEQKLTLDNKVDSITRITNSAVVDEVNRIRRDHIAAVAVGATSEKLPLSAYSALTDPAHEKREDDAKVDVLVGINTEVSRIGAMNPVAQARELARLRSGAATDQGRLIFNGARERLAQVQRMQEEDRVSWLTQYNPAVKKLAEWARELPADSPQLPDRLRQLNAAIMKYQGSPTSDADDRDLYLNLATNDRQIMSLDQAREGATYINQGTPGEVVSRIGQTLARFPDRDHQYVAFNNLVTMPGKDGIRQEYQLAWQNKDQWWVGTFLNALNDSKSFGQLTDERRKALNDEILTDKTWKLFSQAMIGPGGERADEVEGFRSGIAMYANYFHVTQGDKMSTSVRKSVDKLINSTMGFTSVHGRPLMVVRERGEGQPLRTDDEIQDVGRRLAVSLRDLDPREVDQRRFLALRQVSPDEQNVGRLQALRDDVTRNAFFVSDDDGQSMTLYMPGDDGIPFQLRDRDNRAFQIRLDDLPSFTVMTGRPQRRAGIVDESGREVEPIDIAPFSIKEQPRGTYKIQEGYAPQVSTIDRVLGVGQRQTHWPTMAPYWHRREIK